MWTWQRVAVLFILVAAAVVCGALGMLGLSHTFAGAASVALLLRRKKTTAKTAKKPVDVDQALAKAKERAQLPRKSTNKET